MPSLLVRIFLAVLLVCTHPAWAASGTSEGTWVLDDDSTSTRPDMVQTWIDQTSQATISQVAANPSRFQDSRTLARQPLNKANTLWIKLRVSHASSNATHWSLDIPLPNLDEVVLFQKDNDGSWTTQRAGDVLGQVDWARQGLYPDFDFQLVGNGVKDVYLQIRNFAPVAVPIHITSARQRESQRQTELLIQALLLGALLPLAALSLLRYAEHRKLVDVGASGFTLLVIATVGQANGLMNAWVWGSAPPIGNLASTALPLLASGCILLFIRNVFALSTHFRWLDRMLAGVGWGTALCALLVFLPDRELTERISKQVLVVASFATLYAIFLSWRSGSGAARWLAVAVVPQLLGHLYGLLESLDLVPAMYELRYFSSAAVAMTVPIFLYVLSQITHDRKELVVRANHLPTQDALTGLLTKEVFQTHLEGAVARAIETREPIALAMVRVINHGHIRRDFGDTTAEQCLLRAVVKLQRILRDLDPAGRVGTAQFAILMEGVGNRQALSERMVKLIASGLIPLPGLVPEVTLHFQVGCVLLNQNPVPAERVLDDLRDLMGGMSPQSRRPIRFLEALPTEVSVMQTDQAPV